MRQFIKLVVLQLLRAYKWAISPLFPPACRYVPTCSEYAMEAVERYGAFRGGLMAVGAYCAAIPSPWRLRPGGEYNNLRRRPSDKRPTANDAGHAQSEETLNFGRLSKILNKNPAARNGCSWFSW